MRTHLIVVRPEMKYRAIRTKKNRMTYDQRDESAGVIGEFTEIEDETVLFSSDSKEEVELRTKAYYYDNPNEIVYLVDDSNRVLGIFLHRSEAGARSKLSEQTGFAYCLSFIVFLNFVLAALVGSRKIDPSVTKLVVIAATMTLVYIGIVKAKIQNGIEGAVATTILTILAWLIGNRMM